MPSRMVWPLSGIGADLERRIFLRQLAQRDAHFFLVALGLGLDRDRDHGRWKLDGLQHDRMVLIANRIAGRDVPQANARTDVAGVNLGNVFALVGVHLQQTANALGARTAADQHAVALLQMSGVNANESKLTDEGVSHDLESQGRKWGVVFGGALQLLYLCSGQYL